MGPTRKSFFVDDADDSAFRQNFTSTGAFAGPGYVDMPKGRKGFFGRLFGGKKKREEELSTRDWLQVDEDFDARSVGAARGGWESFREDSEYNRDLAYDDYNGEAGEYVEEDYYAHVISPWGPRDFRVGPT